jgi:hypothetical protein
MLHQTLDRPNTADNSNAPGILNVLKTMPLREGGTVFPSPLKALAVVISMHIKNCETPSILKFPLHPSFLLIVQFQPL